MLEAWLWVAAALSFVISIAVAAPLEMRRRMEVAQGLLPKSTPRIFGGRVFGSGWGINAFYVWSRDFEGSPHVNPWRLWSLRMSLLVFFGSFIVLLLSAVF